MQSKFWILCGKPDNWEIALRDEMWGLIPRFRGKWNYLEAGDWLFFHATQPVGGIIGLGQAETKFRQNRPLWPDEIIQNSVLYPFRFEFRPEYVLPREAWQLKRLKIRLPMGSYSGMNLLGDQDIIEALEKAAGQEWGITFKPELPKANIPQLSAMLPSPQLSHDNIKDMIFKIGQIHRYIPEKEYLMNSDRLDVVWRRVEKSVPTYAFEIQVAGDIYHALAKLKHAYDLWNSNIFLVADEIHHNKAQELLAGTFHEIRAVLRIVTLKQIKELYSLQLEDVHLRRLMGLA